ncbi:hypothetical protein BGW37DRAFT_421747 [Umbelopsis sp. PMI_123]|nr:hypothetical protein BGW37DRAFT_421747 [Umbelopsis sp. PMI_123]
MEAIDDLANENIIRSVAFAALQFRQQRHYEGLISISTQLLQQRFRFLGTQANSTDEDRDLVVQWQKDESPRAIDLIWSGHEEDLYQSKIYYKRSDAETLYAMVEFATQDDKHFVVVVAKEDGVEEQEWKYHNTKEIYSAEWTNVIQKEWNTRIEDAERRFIQSLTKHIQCSSTSINGRLAPDDYWGDWSSENASQEVSEESDAASNEGSEDPEDVYYNNWSNHPDTNEGHVEDDIDRSLMEQEEIQEEYDNSHNPLFTVPSVPNLMDMHTSALQELTTILNTTIQPNEGNYNDTQINQLQTTIDQPEIQDSSKQFPWFSHDESNADTNGIDTRETAKAFLMKSLSALVGVARMLGFTGQQISEMVDQIVQQHPDDSSHNREGIIADQ